MSTKIHQTSAKICVFRQRFPPAGLPRGDDKVGPLAGGPVVVEAGSGWYHEAAIREADRIRKP